MRSSSIGRTLLLATMGMFGATSAVSGAASRLAQSLTKSTDQIDTMLAQRVDDRGRRMLYGRSAGGGNKRSRNTVAQDKRRALKARNRKRR